MVQWWHSSGPVVVQWWYKKIEKTNPVAMDVASTVDNTFTWPAMSMLIRSVKVFVPLAAVAC